MQVRRVLGGVEASPQPRARVVLYQSCVAREDGRGVMPLAVPDMEIRPATMGSWGQAKE
jgi:hypothetical protein